MKVILIQRYDRLYQEPISIECDEFSYHALNRQFTYIKDNELYVETHVVDIRMKGEQDGKK